MPAASHHHPDPSRDRILHAAIREFSAHGLAGARTSAIAAAARVNKALLYDYFRDKESLYIAALEEVAGKVAGDALAVLRPASRAERDRGLGAVPARRRLHRRDLRDPLDVHG